MHVPERTLLTLSISIVSLIIVTGCTTLAKEYTELSQAGPLSQRLCFRVEHLPPDFEIVARLMQDNATAALHAADPAEREQEYEEWGRVIGSLHQWKYEPPSMPGEDADGRMSDEEIEQELFAAEKEVLDAAFRSATCDVSIYSTEEGASLAYLGKLDDLQNPTHLAYVDVESVTDVDTVENGVMVVHQYQAPALTRFIVLTRQANIVGEVSISANCGAGFEHSCEPVLERANSLAAFLGQRIGSAVSGEFDEATDTDSESAERSAQQQAWEVCGTRNFSGCVDEYVAYAAGTERVALCRNEYGGWYFEPSNGAVGDDCDDDGYHVFAIAGE